MILVIVINVEPYTEVIGQKSLELTEPHNLMYVLSCV